MVALLLQIIHKLPMKMSIEVSHLSGEAKERYIKNVLEIVLQDLYLLLKSVFMELLSVGLFIQQQKQQRFVVCLSFTCE